MKRNAKKIAAVLLAALALSLASCSVSTGYEGGEVKEPSDVTVDGKSVKDDGKNPRKIKTMKKRPKRPSRRRSFWTKPT